MEPNWHLVTKAWEVNIMSSHILYTYRNLEELRKLQDQREVLPFIFEETKNQIDLCPDICIDISALVYYLQVNKSNIEPAYINFLNMTEDTLIVVDSHIAESAIELFPLLFSDWEHYFADYDVQEEQHVERDEYKPYRRQKIYHYRNEHTLDKIIKYSESKNIPIATFSRVNGDLRNEFEQFNKSYKLAILDLTSISYALEDNKALIYALEQLFCTMQNIRVIAKTSQVDLLLKYFPLFFDGQETVSKLIPDLPIDVEDECEGLELRKITDLKDREFDEFVDTFNHNLIGHSYFKKQLRYALRNFSLLNKVKEQKVFSIFLYGASGIGKTEVARLMANGLQKDCYLAKINFQNYSSQDSLNSLIGSPAGYVGCNHGELSEKIQKSKVGVLLCDEFEKTTRPVFSFFLELLEEGKFTDSMAREYDMDGYVIIFTSNILSENDYKKVITPELQTRFDLVCEFEQPKTNEKIEFLNLLFEQAKEKFSDQFDRITISEDEKDELFNFDYSSLSALRDIRRVFNNRLMDLFSEKGVTL